MQPLDMFRHVQEYDYVGFINLSIAGIIDHVVSKFNQPTSSFETKLKTLDTIDSLLDGLVDTCKKIRWHTRMSEDFVILDNCDIYLETLRTTISNTRNGLSSKNHALTAEEIAIQLVDEIRDTAEHIGKENPHDGVRAASLTAFAILSLMDGCRLGHPMFKLIPYADEETVRDQQEAGENWIEPNTAIDLELHGLFHRDR